MLNETEKNEFLNHYNSKTNKIDGFIENHLKNLENVEPSLKDSLFYAVLNGGKRLRSILCIETGKAFGASEDKLLPFASAIEYIHAYSLVHDDLPGMDNSDTRRGLPSCHIKYGLGPAILTGDALLNLSFELMTDSCINSDNSNETLKAMKIIANSAGVYGMINGQAVDLKVSDSRKASIETLIGLIEQKTMALIRCSVLSGAYIAGCDDDTIKKLDEFSYNLGLAFQIRDDFEDEAEDEASNQNSPNFINILGRDKAKAYLVETSDKAKSIIKEFENTEFIQKFLDYLF